MIDEPENLILTMLRKLDTKIDGLREDMQASIENTNSRLDKIDGKIDKMNIQIIGVKGRITDIETAVQSIANVLDKSGLISA